VSNQPPTIARIALGQMITGMRESAHMTQSQVADSLGMHPDTINRWETGESGVKRTSVIALAHLFKVPAAQLSKMTTLSDQSKQRGALERHPGGAPSEFRMFADFEPVAKEILSYEAEHIPGLVQTPGYLAAAHEAQLEKLTPNREAVQNLRHHRHEVIFSRSKLPKIRMVIGLAAMAYLDQLPAKVRDPQIQQLTLINDRDNVGIRVITTMHSAMSGGFTIMCPDTTVVSANRFVYIEAQDQSRYIEAHDVVSLYDEIFCSVWDRARPLKEYLHGR